jgi:hypothetical protein
LADWCDEVRNTSLPTLSDSSSHASMVKKLETPVSTWQSRLDHKSLRKLWRTSQNKKMLITHKVTTNFFISPCTQTFRVFFAPYCRF